ncbi:Myristoyl-CoA:protein N-myristoyltransferase [Parasponia andersonii]|uniref:Glycylpeptide N-tetradecanoyltransferase n=1 Tax=Parasponia andersonii TaxID=3476 RepID=A0A2P5BE88_PARAD|nr:Myristoyl-CoA:protein N-myristoyltransferase [Parasponia andersonii]
MDSYVAESTETHEITDFYSFFTLQVSVMENRHIKSIKAAYSLYNVSTKTPLVQLMEDALIVANQKVSSGGTRFGSVYKPCLIHGEEKKNSQLIYRVQNV